MENKEEDVVNLFDEGEKKPDEGAPEEIVVEDEKPAFEVPEKFVGKSFEDVVDSYKNLEKEFGRKSNEVGELRKLTDDILRQQTVQPAVVENINESVVEDLDFYDDPEAAVDKAIARNPRLKNLEDRMVREAAQNSHAELIKAHPDVDEVVASQEFVDWIKGSSGRQKMLEESHKNYDVHLASDLLSTFKATQGLSTEAAIEERDAIAAEELKAASLEKGRPSTSSKPVYRRSELIRLKLEQPSRYEAMSKEIHDAYADGRVK